MSSNHNWIPHVLALELKKVFTYRVAFWIQYVFGTLTSIVVAYFLWRAIFDASATPLIQGYSFHGIVFYYVLGTLSSRITMGTAQGGVAQEIFDGTLTRYLLYPLSFIFYKYVTFVSQQLVAVGQLLLGLLLALALWDFPTNPSLSAGSLFVGLLTSLMVGSLFFTMTVCLELVAFWQDTVWNLLAMLRFIGTLLGGLMVPIVFFPTWGQRFTSLTPFPLIFSFPTRCFLGLVSPHEWTLMMLFFLGWLIVFSVLCLWIWTRGTRQYSGVGI